MNNLRSLSLLALVAVLGLAFAGCSDDATTPVDDLTGSDDFAAIDFDDPDGGLTPTDEEVAFGDAFLLQEDARENEELYDDPLMQQDRIRKMSAECDSMPPDGDRPLRKSYFLRVVWGNLDGPVDPETGEVIDIARRDWSGALEIDHGVVLVRRLIRFERGIDSITRPRTDPTSIEWTSFTGGHFDGILFQIIEPARNDESLGPEVANNVRFKAGDFTAQFTTADIPGLDRTADVDDLNSIHFLGFEYNGKPGCPRGFMAGIWHDDPETDDGRGAFRGVWTNIRGNTIGYMRGGYGLTDDGERVFRGKYISKRGEFLGFLHGTWEPGDEPGRGRFVGEWINKTGMREGVLAGRYKQAGDRPGGFYQGRWSAGCSRDAEEIIAP